MDRLLWVTWGGEGLKHGQVIMGHLGRGGVKTWTGYYGSPGEGRG